MPYISPRFKPTTTRTFSALWGIHDVQFEATDIIDTEKESAPAGYFLVARFSGVHTVEVGHFGVDTIPELAAYTWLCYYRPPEPEKPPRRGLLWHLITAAQRWVAEGY